ncbi:maleylacetoacetate isomerase [Curvibacter sp. CHRR-16]|uniref:maleylacetoacetate isomerase n=1 Tax=Curvibacter sp. CHRR-16 TaxID=2835872 RepID=UPI001BDA3FD4|nr:maleylacetoacetate isomerase [Curvibacter sp. CHRR-16]MBT0568889.1 maleylacetoacetate isomerase [Curvibacter sp. CHRR-16]
MKLYTYFRSSAAYRVRIGLALKGLAYESIPVHLLRGGGEQHMPAYSAINPQQLVPALDDAGVVLTQSLAVLEYLDEAYPHTMPLLPAQPLQRARVRALAQAVACDMHPINNLRVLQYLEQQLGLIPEAKQAWYQHWVQLGFAALEQQLASSPETGLYCHGDVPTQADCCLVPQVFNALRFDADMQPYPTITRIYAHCLAQSAFAQAAPAAQLDAQ